MIDLNAGYIVPDWPAPSNVRAFTTLRRWPKLAEGGHSRGAYAAFNLADHVGDDAQAVAANRAALRAIAPERIAWLHQTHSTICVDATYAMQTGATEEADAVYSQETQLACAVLTADCLPVLFTDPCGSIVAAAHAGWRGLCAGILESTISAMPTSAATLMAWLGPAIGPEAFVVGADVRDEFIAEDAGAAAAFRPQDHDQGSFLADIYQLARSRLYRAGITQIYGGGYCTVGMPEAFYSFRREAVTGRMASLIWKA